MQAEPNASRNESYMQDRLTASYPHEGSGNIVIIGANEFQYPLIMKAKEMGFRTHVFAWTAGDVGESAADVFYPISIIEKEQILEKCKEIQPEAVVSIGSDLAAITVQYLSEKLGLNCNSARCIELSTNKYKMRQALSAGGVKCPGFIRIQEGEKTDECSKLSFPVIVKPTDRSGSRGITRLEGPDGLEEALSAAWDNSFEHKAIVEEYIEGPEYSCECISFAGEHHFLQVTKKYTTGAPHYIETAQLEPSDLSDEEIERVKKEVFKALDALEITDGASHSEFKMDCSGNPRIIEIGARMGGDCIGSDLVMLSTGYDFVRMVIEVALGKAPRLEKIRTPMAAAIRFVFDERDTEVLSSLERENPEAIWRRSEISDVRTGNVVDSSSRHGFYIVTADSRDKAMQLAGLGPER